MPVVLGMRNPVSTSAKSPLASLGSFDLALLVHGEQGLTLHQPLPVAATAITQGRIAAIYDKGKAAVVVLESEARDKATGAPLFTSRNSMFIRGEGGWGGDRGPSVKFSPPDRAPDHVVSYATRSDQALLYRLNGDRNPLHSDPQFTALGFPADPPRSCTYGFTGRAAARRLWKRSRSREVHRRAVLVTGDAWRDARRQDLGRRQPCAVPDVRRRSLRHRWWRDDVHLIA
jgi:hypothetical protein